LNHPVFMTFESSGYTEKSYPIEMAWTLHDGCYKSIYIKPEDHWTEWDPGLESQLGKSRQDLMDMGESGLDVIREIDLDAEQGRIYVEDMGMAEIWLGNLFAAFGKELPFELLPFFDLFPTLDRQDFDDERRFLLESNNLSHSSAEDQILVLQRLWADFGEKQGI